MTTSVDRIVVLGSGLAGWTTVRELRKLAPDLPVTVVTADAGDFYAKPSLSNAFAQGRQPQQLVGSTAVKMAETLGVTLLQRTRASVIDCAGHVLVTDQGPVPYSKLVLATGAQPIRVPLEGDGADAVRSVNSLDDFAAFHAELRPGARVAIMGAGLIGCEFANDLAGAGFQVSVVDPSTRPLAALLPEAASEALRAALQALGVQWHFGTTVRSLHRQRDALQLQLADGGSFEADVVLSAVGLRADIALARAAGLVCDRGIVVDSALATTEPDIFALGDCAQYGTGSWAVAPVAGGDTLPYVLPIMSAAKVLAARLAGGRDTLRFALMPISIKTPALPLVVASPALASTGQWYAPEEGLWHFIDAGGVARGFVLAGKQTSRRAELARLLAV
ncbi:MAG: FAD-dependent oxidoreductase [Ramlibacter sp.]|nr:FAD-dependent oxidoreductase [Ramlibacter sp.]